MNSEIRKRTYKLILSPSYDSTKVSKRTRIRWKNSTEKARKESNVNASNATDDETNTSDINILDPQPGPSSADNFTLLDVLEKNNAPTTDSALNDDHNSTILAGTSSNATTSNAENLSLDDTSSEDSIEELNDSSSIGSESGNDESEFDLEDEDESENERNPRFDTDGMHGNSMMFPQSQLKVSDVLLMIESYAVTSNLTRRNQEDLVNLLKIAAGPDFESWNASHYARGKAFNSPREKIKLHFYCEINDCYNLIASKSLSEKLSEIQTECVHCKSKYKLSSESSNQFMSIDIKYQLEIMFNDASVQSDLLKTVENIKRTSEDGIIRDVHDGRLYKQIQQRSPGALTYNMNTDGAPMFKSSSRSFWPIQFHINELSPRVRFRNVILGGLFVTSKEPKAEFMKRYFSVFIEQAENIMNDGINFTLRSTGEIVNYKLYCLLLCMDSVARPVAQVRLQYNGHYGCSWCYAYGFYDGSAMRYPLCEIEPSLRSHESHVQDVQQVEMINRAGKTINGVKGRSELLRLNHFDCVWGFPIDYMHGVLLGVSKQLWTIWTTATRQCYLGPRDRKIIEDRRLKIKRPHEMHRLARPIKYAAKWKASEWESWLLLDSIPCLEGVLDDKCFESYILFVRSVNALLKSEISEADLRICEYDLFQFVGECEILYGEEAMTFNLHSIVHLCESVRQSGPLWASSTFPFENGIFYFKRFINAPHGVSHQMANKFLKKKLIQSNIDNASMVPACRNYCTGLFQPTRLANSIKSDNGVTLIGASRYDERIQAVMVDYVDAIRTPIQLFDRCIYEGIVLRSKAYMRPKKTDDTVVQLISGKIMEIYNFVLVDNQCYLYGREMLILPYKFNDRLQLDHIFELSDQEGDVIVVAPECVQRKVIRFNTGIKNYIAFFPKILGM